MKERIQKLFCDNKSAEAFWALAENVMTDSYCQKMFLRVVNIKSHVIKLFEDIDRIKQLADKGNPYMQYAYARLHDVLYFAEDSMTVSEKYYAMAMEAGISDARMQLAYMYRDGDLGEYHPRLYCQYMEQALAENSVRAIQNKLYEMIYGSDFIEKDTEKALELIDRYITSCDEEPDPYFLCLRAKAEEQLGMKDKATKDYELAAIKGFPEALFFLAMMTCFDDEFKITDAERFSALMERGQDAGVPACYLETAFIMDSFDYKALDEKNQEECHRLLKNQLILSSEMGDDLAGYYLGYYHEQGINGFEQDYGQAWKWYSRGALLRSYFCFENISRMILEDFTAPEKYSEEYGYECAYHALILGSDSLDTVMKGYKNGYLTHHAAVIEEIFLPRYEKENSDCDDDSYDDSYDDEVEGQEIEEDCYKECETYDSDRNIDRDRDRDIDILMKYYDPDIEYTQPKEKRENSEETISPQSLEELLNHCHDYVDKINTAIKEHNQTWKVAEWTNKYADIAERMKSYEQMTNHLYSLNSKIIDLIFDHPRLKLRICRIQYDVLSWIEAKEEHCMGITEDIMQEINELSKCISLADEGRLEEIPQTGHLRRDPIEWTKKWEISIDEADRLAYEEIEDLPRGMGWCFAFWAARYKALKKFGIEWKSPAIMNPNVLFD